MGKWATDHSGMSAISSLTAQAAGADNGVAVTMLGKGLSSAKEQAASLLSVLPQPPFYLGLSSPFFFSRA